MNRIVKPSVIDGIVSAPASKSIAQRAIAVAALTKGVSEVYNAGNSEDVRNCIQVSKTLGSFIKEQDNKLIIRGGINYPQNPLDCGESGLAFRVFSGIAATFNSEITITGSGTLLQRSMTTLEQTLKSIGVDCKTSGGKPPVVVKGPMHGGEYFVNGSDGSQVLSGILIASPLANADILVKVSNLKSKPYIDLTIEVMRAFGVQVVNNNYSEFFIKAGQTYKPTTYFVEGDWSSAAFLLAAGAIAGRVRVNNLEPSSLQADKAILDALVSAGAKILVHDNFVEVKKEALKGFLFDATHCPDLFPPLVAIAAHCHGKTVIKGIERLRSKESDRAQTLQSEFGKMGLSISLENDTMVIIGSVLKSARVLSHGDHRIAMCCAIVALAGTGDLIIENSEAVTKSYPDFFEDLESLTNKHQ